MAKIATFGELMIRLQRDPSEKRTVQRFHQLSWGKSARRVNTTLSSRTLRPKSRRKAALGSRLMPQLWKGQRPWLWLA